MTAEYMTNSNFYVREGILKKRWTTVLRKNSLYSATQTFLTVGPTAVTYSENLRFFSTVQCSCT